MCIRDRSLLDQALRTQPAAAGETAASPTPPGGCILVLDTHSGDVLTVANAPRFDVNQMIRPSGDTWNATITDPRHPLFPRATQMTVPPGSVFKVLSAAAMLESSDINPAEHRFCQGATLIDRTGTAATSSGTSEPATTR